jgi:hypothetical protein
MYKFLIYKCLLSHPFVAIKSAAAKTTAAIVVMAVLIAKIEEDVFVFSFQKMQGGYKLRRQPIFHS